MKVLALTSIRSDYDIMSPLYKLLHEDLDIDFKLLVSGAHLSEEFGYTVQHIKDDGFSILLEIETLVNSQSLSSRLKTASIFLQNSIDIVKSFNPDVILYAGDREDVIIGGLLGTYLSIPTIHFYGGDHEKDGHQDTAIRHATSKLSHIHFASNKEHKNRLIAMGESPKRIFDIGSISLDKFFSFKKLNLNDNFKQTIPEKFALLIYHPLENEDNALIFSNILETLKEKNIFTFISFPNTDPGYQAIVDIINKEKEYKNFIFYKNLSRDLFLSVFSECTFMIGNSSAGIYEAATIKKPVLNVGLRQKERMCAQNVIFCDTSKEEISSNIDKLFEIDLSKIINPYGDGKSSQKAHKLIKELSLKEFLYKTEDPLEVKDENE